MKLDSLTAVGTAVTATTATVGVALPLDEVTTGFNLLIGLVTVVLQIVNFFKKKKPVA